MKFKHLFLSLLSLLLVTTNFNNHSDGLLGAFNYENDTFINRNANGAPGEIQSSRVNESIGNKVEIKMLDLGCRFGDSTLIRYKDINMLIDAGGNKNDSGPLIYNAIKDLSKIDYMIFTHADNDHISNFLNDQCIKKWIDVEGRYIDTFIDFDDPDLKDIYKQPDPINSEDELQQSEHVDIKKNYVEFCNYRDELISRKKIKNYYTASECLKNGNKGFFAFEKGSKDGLRILDNYFYKNNFTSEHNLAARRNLVSVCTLITVQDQKYLFTGDIEEYQSQSSKDEKVEEYGKAYNRIYGESFLAALNYEYLKDGVDFYKAAHHGSYTSNSSNFMDLIRPKYIGVSASIPKYNSNLKFRFPGQISLFNMEKWTDYIYINDYYESENEDGSGAKIVPYYGDIIYRYDLTTKETEFTSSELEKGSNLNVSGVIDTNIVNRRKHMFNIYALSSEDNGDGLYYYFNNRPNFKSETPYDQFKNQIKEFYLNKPSVNQLDKNPLNNATYIKFGHIDILINLGIDGDDANKELVKKVEMLCNDNVLDYLIISNYEPSSYNSLISSKGLLKSKKIKEILNFYHFGESIIDKNDNVNERKLKDLDSILKNQKLSKANIKTSDNLSNTSEVLLTNNEDFNLTLNFLKLPYVASNIKPTSQSFCDYNLMFTIDLNSKTYANLGPGNSPTKKSSVFYRYLNLGSLKEYSQFEALKQYNNDLITKVDVYDLVSHGYLRLINNSLSVESALFRKMHLYMSSPLCIFNGTLNKDNMYPSDNIYKPGQSIISTSYIDIKNPKNPQKKMIAGNIVIRFVYGPDDKDAISRITYFGSRDIDYFSLKVNESIKLKQKYRRTIGSCFTEY